jgi:hypothetical protein
MAKNIELGTLDIYTWNWTAGGYNSCMAQNRTEAIRKAHAMTDRLMPDLKTLRKVTAAEMVEIDRSWSSACD